MGIDGGVIPRYACVTTQQISSGRFDPRSKWTTTPSISDDMVVVVVLLVDPLFSCDDMVSLIGSGGD